MSTLAHVAPGITLRLDQINTGYKVSIVSNISQSNATLLMTESYEVASCLFDSIQHAYMDVEVNRLRLKKH